MADPESEQTPPVLEEAPNLGLQKAEAIQTHTGPITREPGAPHYGSAERRPDRGHCPPASLPLPE